MESQACIRLSLSKQCHESQRQQDGEKPQGCVCRRIAGQSPLPSFRAESGRRAVFNDVSAVFRSTAEGETGHAHGHLEYLEAVGDPATGLPIGETRLNLKAAIAGETHEYTDMYPGMAKAAREEGFAEIADWFETLAKAERSHANRFQKALDGI
jgi:rubrerythrin